MSLAVIYLEDTCCHYFIVRVHDLDLKMVYLEKRMWSSIGSGMSLDDYIKEFSPNEIEIYNWIDRHSDITHIGNDTEKVSDRDFEAIDSLSVKSAKAMVEWEIEKSRDKRLAEIGHQ